MSLFQRLLQRNEAEVVRAEEPMVVAPEHWYFCLLRCADGSLYADIAQDVDVFVKMCNDGKKKIAYLSGRLPVFVAFSEEYMSERAAKDRLFGVQSMTRDKKERLVSSVGLERIRV